MMRWIGGTGTAEAVPYVKRRSGTCRVPALAVRSEDRLRWADQPARINTWAIASSSECVIVNNDERPLIAWWAE